MNKTNVKRVLSIVGVVCLFAVTMVIYQENTTYDYTDGVSFFKKYYQPHEGSIHKFMHKHSYDCGHSKIVEQEKLLDQPKQAFDESLFDHDDISKVLPIEKAFNNIRIAMDYSNMAKEKQEIQDYIKTMMIPPIMNYLQDLVLVQRLTAPIVVDPAYKDQPCGVAEIVIPKDHLNQGVNDADLIFYIKTYRDGGKLLAYASYCPQGRSYGLASGRPTVAYININLNFLERDLSSKDPMIMAKWIFVALHETIHSLVFSPNYFDNFLLEKKPVTKIGSKTYVTAPSIVELAQYHFACPSLSKVPLEDEGGPATYGTHWERKVFGNEMMTGSQMYDSVFSKFTAQMFIASGWYQINDVLLSTLTWGLQEKCDFVEYSCSRSNKEFCQGKSKRCSYDYASPGECSNQDSLADSCSYWEPYFDSHCNYPVDDLKKVYTTSGGSWGGKARCFDTDLAEKAKYPKIESICLESRCDFSGSSAIVVFKVFDKEYKCGPSVKEVNIPGKGVVTCPDVVRFCFSLSNCPQSCTGRGICKMGKCVCYKGFTGEDCSKVKQ